MNETRYRVTFSVTLDGFSPALRTSTVSLSEGYSTFSDIPKIVTIPLGIKPEDIIINTVSLLP